jgi:hypothetical protein
MWITKAVRASDNSVEVTFRQWNNGIGYNFKTLFLDTKPNGDWNTIKFGNDSDACVIDFLECMVERNLDVQRTIATLCLEDCLQAFEGNFKKMNKLMNYISILDPTFTAPLLNETCRWQNELLHEIVSRTAIGVIKTCRNYHRLCKYSRVLQVL